MPDAEFSLIGVEKLKATIASVKYDMSRKGGRFALRKAANFIARKVEEGAARLNDPKTPQDISANVAVRFSSRTFKRTGDLMFRVGILGGAGGNMSHKKQESKWPGGDTRHWRLLEFGTEKMAARPFVRPALEQNIGQATHEFVTHYQKALDRAIKRAAKKG